MIWFRLVTGSCNAANAASGCEKAKSDYNLSKSKRSSSLTLPMIRAMLRVKINGLPLSKFHLKEIQQRWMSKGHQYEATVTEKKLVIDRIRKEDDLT